MDRDVSVPARAIGDPSRARMLAALVGGARLPAGDLARVAGVAASTASEHLRCLLDAGLVEVAEAGRQRHYTLAGPDVAAALEALQVLAPAVPVRSLRGHRIAGELVAGRTCYDHLAGDLGLRLTDLLVGAEVLGPVTAGKVLPALHRPDHPLVAALRLDAVVAGRRPFARGCLDWSGRRPHLAGALGAHLLTDLVARGWVERRPGSRAVRLTAVGSDGLAALPR